MWCWVAGFLAGFVVGCVVRVVFGIAVDFVFCWRLCLRFGCYVRRVGDLGVGLGWFEWCTIVVVVLSCGFVFSVAGLVFWCVCCLLLIVLICFLFVYLLCGVGLWCYVVWLFGCCVVLLIDLVVWLICAVILLVEFVGIGMVDCLLLCCYVNLLLMLLVVCWCFGFVVNSVDLLALVLC